MLSRLPWTPKPSGKKLKARDRGAAARRETMTAAVVRILDCGRSSKFEYEASCRHGLRAGVCLEGESWSRADAYAAAIVSEALHRLGADQRPSWWQGQPEYVDTDTSRGWCARRGCERPIPIDRGARGIAAKYCSVECCNSAGNERKRKFGARMDLASCLAMHAARSQATMEARARHCDHCGRHFLTRVTDRKYCSHACFSAAQTVHGERPCEACGKIFRPKNWGGGIARFCSRACSDPSRRKPREERSCLVCGTKFMPKFPSRTQKFCSLGCAKEARYRIRKLTETERASFVDTREAAALVGLKVSTFRHYLAMGHGPERALKHRGRVHFRRTDLDAWRKARSVISTDGTA